MLDLIGAIALSSLSVLNVVLLAAFTPLSAKARLYATTTMLFWGSLIVVVAALHGFERAPNPGVPNVAFGVLPPLAAGALAWLLFRSARNALIGIPAWLLVTLNVGRVLGAFFLLLWAEDRLSAPFAPAAGWGDVATGLLAIPLALHLVRARQASAALAAWNIFGALDLIVAVGLGVASAPDATFRIFTAPPGSAVMGTLPRVLIPTVLVPFYLMTHVALAAQLWRGRTAVAGQARPSQHCIV